MQVPPAPASPLFAASVLPIAVCGIAAYVLFASAGSTLMPHGMCFLWNPGLVWSNAIADTIIGVSYAIITALLIGFLVRQRIALTFHWTVIAFAAFILACGTGHLIDVVTLWVPVYWLATGVKFVTALASGVTAAALPFVFPRLAEIVREARNAGIYRAEIDQLNAELSAQLSKLEAAYAELESDAAERERVALRLDYLAHHDTVTGLPNRVRLMQRFGTLIELSRRSGATFFVVYLDLDRFKPVNDAFGHSVGDTVLAEVGQRIGLRLRAGDTVSRVGGDEFVLLCATTDAAADAPRLAMRLLRAIAEPMEIDSRNIVLGASIGISLFPTDSDDPEALIVNADMAMYRAKQSGRNGFALYSPEIDVRVVDAPDRLGRPAPGDPSPIG